MHPQKGVPAAGGGVREMAGEIKVRRCKRRNGASHAKIRDSFITGEVFGGEIVPFESRDTISPRQKKFNMSSLDPRPLVPAKLSAF